MKCEDKKYFGVEKKTYLKNLHDDTHTHTHTHTHTSAGRLSYSSFHLFRLLAEVLQT